MTFTSLPLDIDFEANHLLSYKSGFTVYLETPVPEKHFPDFATSITEVWHSVMTECKSFRITHVWQKCSEPLKSVTFY